jgi:hypothetical protein
MVEPNEQSFHNHTGVGSKNIGPGTLRRILRDLDIGRSEFGPIK